MDPAIEMSKVLVVDDNPRNLFSFKRILDAPNREMLTAASGDEALQLLLDHPDVSLILMDVQMPGMDGFETTELIRGQTKFRDLPILFISAFHLSDEFARRGFQVGASDYVTKPVDGSVLTSKVNVFLTMQQQKRQLAREIADREYTEVRLAHLNRVLRAIRDVNQLIVREKRLSPLIQDACQILVERRGFDAAWIILTDEALGKYEVANAGLPEDAFEALIARFRKITDLPECFKQAKSGVFLIDKDVLAACCGCPLAKVHTNTSTMVAPLAHEGHHYGYISVSVPVEFSGDTEEISLLEEVAGDIGFALHGITAESELQDSEARIQVYFDESIVGMAITSPDRRWLRVNQCLCDMLGYTREELNQMTWEELTHPEDLNYNLEQFRRVENGEIEGYTLDKRFIRQKGEIVQAIISAKAIRKPNGTIDYLLVQFQDITQRRHMEEQVQQQERLAAVGQLAAGIAHDFNNLLTSIIGYAELLRRRSDVPLQEGLAHIASQGQRAAQLTRQILDFGRQSVRDPRPMDVAAYMKEILTFIQRTIPENVHIQLFVEPDDYIVVADATQLQQIVTNLAVNARDAMPDGGRLTFRLSKQSLPAGETPPYPGMEAGKWVVLSVSDTGMGIPPDILPHIFEPFFTTKAAGQGTGLGLAQVYGIVKQHNGEIVVNSSLGQGTTFSIYLPEASGPTDKADDGNREPIQKGEGEMILLVEDSPAVRDIIRASLEMLGYQVVTASDGVEALAIYADHKDSIRLVLTDVVMPKMDGIELLRALKAKNPDIKVLMMSGYPFGDDLDPDIRKHVHAMLEKPPEVEQLANALKSALS